MSSAEISLSRNIVKKGIMILEPSDREVSYAMIYTRIEREPKSPYKNLKYSVPKGFFGYVQGLFRGFVMWEQPIEYPAQVIKIFDAVEIEKFPTQVCLHQYTYALLNKVAFTAFVADNPPKHPLGLQSVRLDLDAIAVTCYGESTVVLDYYGRGPNIPCDNPIEWVEPSGIPANSGPTSPAAPPASVPVNPEDPDGLDLPSAPYDRESDDEGYSYDPPREGDGSEGPPEGVEPTNGPGWYIYSVYQSRLPDSPGGDGTDIPQLLFVGPESSISNVVRLDALTDETSQGESFNYGYNYRVTLTDGQFSDGAVVGGGLSGWVVISSSAYIL